MRRAMVFLIVSSLVLAGAVAGGEKTVAQTGASPVSNSAQLQLPSSAFPSDYSENGNEAWTPANADGSTFSKEHVKSYAQLGMLGAWYEYYAKTITAMIQGVIVVAPVEVAYLGTYYPDATGADAAFSDILSNSQVTNTTPCSYGTRCVTFRLDLQWNGPTYSGVVRIVEQGNAVAEIRSDVFQNLYDQVGVNTFTSNVDGVSQAFVQAVRSLVPTSTPVPPTATPTSTATPTPPPTSTPTTTATATLIPLSFRVLSVRAERLRSKPDPTLQRAPIKQVKVGQKVYLSIYVLVQSAPPDSRGTATFRLTSGTRTVLHRTIGLTIPSSETATYRWTTTFKASKPGTQTFRGSVTINGQTDKASTTIRVVA